MARPLKEISQKDFEKLCGLQCTKEEICGFFDVMAIFWPISRFISVDFPTLGRPISAATPDLNRSFILLFSRVFSACAFRRTRIFF